jgi:hypothetical protein
VLVEDREEQHCLADVHGGVEDHEEGAEDQDRLLSGDAGNESALPTTEFTRAKPTP